MEIKDAINTVYIISAADITSRVVFPFITTTLNASPIKVFLIGVIGMSIVKLLLLNFNFPYAMIIYLCVFFGIFRALTVVNQILIIADFCKNFCPPKLCGMLGISFVIKSIFLVLLGYLFNELTTLSLNISIRIYSHLILQSIVILIWSLVLT